MTQNEIENIGSVFLIRLEHLESPSKHEMIIDSGGTSHMTNDERLFNNITIKPIGKVNKLIVKNLILNLSKRSN